LSWTKRYGRKEVGAKCSSSGNKKEKGSVKKKRGGEAWKSAQAGDLSTARRKAGKVCG